MNAAMAPYRIADEDEDALTVERADGSTLLVPKSLLHALDLEQIRGEAVQTFADGGEAESDESSYKARRDRAMLAQVVARQRPSAPAGPNDGMSDAVEQDGEPSVAETADEFYLADEAVLDANRGGSSAEYEGAVRRRMKAAEAFDAAMLRRAAADDAPAVAAPAPWEEDPGAAAAWAAAAGRDPTAADLAVPGERDAASSQPVPPQPAPSAAPSSSEEEMDVVLPDDPAERRAFMVDLNERLRAKGWPQIALDDSAGAQTTVARPAAASQPAGAPESGAPGKEIPLPAYVTRQQGYASDLAAARGDAAQRDVGTLSALLKSLDAEGAAKAADEAKRTKAELAAQMDDMMLGRAGPDGKRSGGMLDMKIDPRRYYDNLGTAQKIGQAISVALGAFGTGMTGMPNFAAKMIDDAIERDIEAQRSDIARSGQRFQFYLHKLKDLDAATDAYRADIELAAALQMKRGAAQLTVDTARTEGLANGDAIEQDARAKMQAAGDRYGQRLFEQAKFEEEKRKTDLTHLAAMTGHLTDYDKALLAKGLFLDRRTNEIRRLTGMGVPMASAEDRRAAANEERLALQKEEREVTLGDGRTVRGRGAVEARNVRSAQVGYADLSDAIRQGRQLFERNPSGWLLPKVRMSKQSATDFETAKAVYGKILQSMRSILLAGQGSISDYETKVLAAMNPELTDWRPMSTAPTALYDMLGRSMARRLAAVINAKTNVSPKLELPPQMDLVPLDEMDRLLSGTSGQQSFQRVKSELNPPAATE